MDTNESLTPTDTSIYGTLNWLCNMLGCPDSLLDETDYGRKKHQTIHLWASPGVTKHSSKVIQLHTDIAGKLDHHGFILDIDKDFLGGINEQEFYYHPLRKIKSSNPKTSSSLVNGLIATCKDSSLNRKLQKLLEIATHSDLAKKAERRLQNIDNVLTKQMLLIYHKHSNTYSATNRWQLSIELKI